MGSHWQLSASVNNRRHRCRCLLPSAWLQVGRQRPIRPRADSIPRATRTIIVAAVPDRARWCWIVTYRTPRPILLVLDGPADLPAAVENATLGGRNPTLRGQQAQELLPGLRPQHRQRLPARLEDHSLHLIRLAALIRRCNRTTTNGRTANAFTRFKGSMVAAGKSSTKFEAAYLWPRRNTSTQTYCRRGYEFLHGQHFTRT
jgi:hypothetical protein